MSTIILGEIYVPGKDSQLQFKYNTKGQKCLVYTEDMVTKANDGGLTNMKSDRKIVWVYPSSNIACCPVQLVEKYLKLCPDNYYQKPNFYLQSLQRPTLTKWYASQVVGQNTLGNVIKTMLHDARIDGYFTGHSLRRSGTTRLFQTGVDRKLIKEMPGYRSDAVDCYAITSEEQKKELSSIIAKKTNELKPVVEENVQKEVKVDEQESICNKSVSSVSLKHDGDSITSDIKSSELGNFITSIIDKGSKKGKTVIRLEIEISHD